jgi:hypothetical protein
LNTLINTLQTLIESALEGATDEAKGKEAILLGTH